MENQIKRVARMIGDAKKIVVFVGQASARNQAYLISAAPAAYGTNTI